VNICKACRDKRNHTKVEWRNHPLAGHGFTPETGWTHPEAKRLHVEESFIRKMEQNQAAVRAVGGPR